MPISLTDNDDYHLGTLAAEHIIGRRGNDTIIGGGGADTLEGWAGDDELISYGSGGLLSGNTGNDYLEAKKTSYGQYHLYGGDGDDTFVMHLDNNYGWGHQGFHVFGRDQADQFLFVGIGTTNAPMLSRIDDFDISQDSLWVDDVEINLNDLPANMRVVNYHGQQWLVIDNNVMIGLEGARMYAPPGVPTMMGGASEMHFPAFPTNLASLATVEFIDQVNFVPYSLYENVFASLNQLSGTLTTSGADYFYGHSENSILNMGGGNDVVNAGSGRDTIRGGGGDDLIAGGQDNDVLFGDAGNDQIWGGSENDEISGGKGADSLDGGVGTDTADYSTSADGVVVRLWNGTGQGGDAQGDVLVNIENVTGSDQNDALIGADNVNNVLSGGGGADYLNGLSGINTADYSTSADGVVVRLWNGTGQGGDAQGDVLVNIENVTGSDQNDVLIGANNVNNVLSGGGGADYLNGLSGINTADYSTSADGVVVRLWNGTGQGGDAQGDVLVNIENVTGSDQNDALIGANNVNNVLSGGGGADYLNGLSGDDTLIGGAGDDNMAGGAGADEFQFAVGFGHDVVTDFDVNNFNERIDLSAVTAITGLTDLINDHMTQVGADVVIDAGDGNTITLLNVNLGDLDANDFIF